MTYDCFKLHIIKWIAGDTSPLLFNVVINSRHPRAQLYDSLSQFVILPSKPKMGNNFIYTLCSLQEAQTINRIKAHVQMVSTRQH